MNASKTFHGGSVHALALMYVSMGMQRLMQAKGYIYACGEHRTLQQLGESLANSTPSSLGAISQERFLHDFCEVVVPTQLILAAERNGEVINGEITFDLGEDVIAPMFERWRAENSPPPAATHAVTRLTPSARLLTVGRAHTYLLLDVPAPEMGGDLHEIKQVAMQVRKDHVGRIQSMVDILQMYKALTMTVDWLEVYWLSGEFAPSNKPITPETPGCMPMDNWQAEVTADGLIQFVGDPEGATFHDRVGSRPFKLHVLLNGLEQRQINPESAA